MEAALSDELGHQAPASGRAETYAECWRIVTHPAFRLGFLDAQHGRPFDHDAITARIVAETPASALRRLKFMPDMPDMLGTRAAIELAQYRYEEGRLAVLAFGLRCRKWGHPDFPPAAVRDYLRKRCEAELRAAAERMRAELQDVDVLGRLKGAA